MLQSSPTSAFRIIDSGVIPNMWGIGNTWPSLSWYGGSPIAASCWGSEKCYSKSVFRIIIGNWTYRLVFHIVYQRSSDPFSSDLLFHKTLFFRMNTCEMQQNFRYQPFSVHSNIMYKICETAYLHNVHCPSQVSLRMLFRRWKCRPGKGGRRPQP